MIQALCTKDMRVAGTKIAGTGNMQNVKAFVVVAGDVMGMMGTVSYLRQFAPDTSIFLTDPKDRNSYTTRERVKSVLPGIPIFNSLNTTEVTGIIGQILRN